MTKHYTFLINFRNLQSSHSNLGAAFENLHSNSQSRGDRFLDQGTRAAANEKTAQVEHEIIKLTH